MADLHAEADVLELRGASRREDDAELQERVPKLVTSSQRIWDVTIDEYQVD